LSNKFCYSQATNNFKCASRSKQITDYFLLTYIAQPTELIALHAFLQPSSRFKNVVWKISTFKPAGGLNNRIAD